MVWLCTEFRKDDFRWEIFLVTIRVVFLLHGRIECSLGLILGNGLHCSTGLENFAVVCRCCSKENRSSVCFIGFDNINFLFWSR